jgi:hypothetical protein
MAIRLFTPANLDYFTDRINSITVETERLWGTMSAPKMLRHLRLAFEGSLGEMEAQDRSNFLTRTVLRYIVFHLWTNWPKGRIKVPANLTPEPEGDLDFERGKLLTAADRFLAALGEDPARPGGVHPLFGRQTVGYWSRIHGVHMDHHLRQFGV